MPILTVIHRRASGGAVIGVEGLLDVSGVDELRMLVSDLDVDGPVTLDFHRVVSVSDLAIARLAEGLLQDSDRVLMVGLSVHQHRLLKYIGMGGRVATCARLA